MTTTLALSPASPPIAWAHAYVALGWALAPIPPGTKNPVRPRWSSADAWIDTPEKVDAEWRAHPDASMGLVHAGSGTVAFDVDDVDATRMIFSQYGFDLDAILDTGLRIQGNPQRAKAIYRAPLGITTRRPAAWKNPANPAQSVTLFELRAGAHQDVLPPSLHPSGSPYRWVRSPFDVDEIPTLPDALIDLWHEWEQFSATLPSFAPWALAAHTLPQQAPRSTDHHNVIGQFNDRVSLHELLTAHGYVQRGKRYLAPSSTTRLPGVNVLGDRVFSHHGADPLADGHAHDPFDVFRILAHRGDMRVAVKAAAEWLGLPLPAPAPADLSAFLNGAAAAHTFTPYRARAASDAAPSDLHNPPGVLGDIVAHDLATAIRPIPAFATQAALAIGSVLCARRYRTSLNNYASLYFVNVARSGSGKEHAKTTIETILRASAVSRLIGPAGYTSGGAVYSALLSKPAHLTIIDEFGKYLAAAAGGRDLLRSQVRDMLVETFGHVAGEMSAPQYSTMTLSPSAAKEMEPRIVQRPAITLLGLTTPGAFYDAMSSGRIEDGFLNRLLVVEHDAERTLSRDHDDVAEIPIPARITQWVQQIAAPHGDLDSLHRQDHLPAPVRVPLTECAKRLARAFEQEMVTLANSLERDHLGDMPIRTREIGLRVALIAALADTPDTPVITDDVLAWAFRYVAYYLRQTLDALRGRIADSDVQKMRNEILRAVRDAGQRGLTEREMNRSSVFTRYSKRDRDHSIDSLQKAELVAWARIAPPGKPGRPREALVALDPDAEPMDAAG